MRLGKLSAIYKKHLIISMKNLLNLPIDDALQLFYILSSNFEYFFMYNIKLEKNFPKTPLIYNKAFENIYN